ncbi:hypothetical protein PMM47T1_22882 [Pseudomonas sp. M47T1]|uniref:hypothetical protein n=1 Tax=Pseudomonas sp. M47T1 TaxID=1179778 RepID=UPI000260701A|nr:hypothetical protein [Pseudomonas sp. M47T1]EIK94283.1 hypothetical protein PMM47T1_22882 [Pseudomonas sp. M47T1]
MTDFIQLDPADPVLHLDAGASLPDLIACALRRINTGKELLNSMTCMRLADADTQDLNSVCDAAYRLIEDGSQVLVLAERRWQRDQTGVAVNR